MAIRDYAYWHHLIRCTVIQRGDNYPDICHRAALICEAAEKEGNQCGVWHAISQAAGTLERCPCYPCSEKRKDFA